MSKKRLELLPADTIEVKIHNGENLVFENKQVIGFIQGEVSEIGNGVKINFTKEYAKNKIYVVVCK